jgi:uncharacterized protein (DUF305 family)
MRVSAIAFLVVTITTFFFGTEAFAQRHSHQHANGDNVTSSTLEYQAVHRKMMRAMRKPFTGDPEVDYRTHMIPHHQGAMDMSRVALRYARDPWTRQIAQAILIAQQQEIAQFQNELARRGAAVPSGGRPRYIITASTYPDPEKAREEEMSGSREELVGKTWAPGSGEPLQGQLQPRMIGEAVNGSATQEFRAAKAKMMKNMKKPFTGDPDVDFRTHMIPHHQGAIDMSRVALRHARNEWTRQSAQAIITAQEREVYRFRTWLAQRAAD